MIRSDVDRQSANFYARIPFRKTPPGLQFATAKRRSIPVFASCQKAALPQTFVYSHYG
jgi:hypothetical protein